MKAEHPVWIRLKKQSMLQKKKSKKLDDMKNVGQHEDGDYILEDGKDDVLEEKKRKNAKNQKSERKPEQSPQKNPRFEIGSNARVQKALKEAGLIATLPTEKEDTSPAVEEAEKKERSTPPAAQHLRLVRKEEEENLGERRDQSDSEMKSFSERWLEKKHKRLSSVRRSQKDLRFTLIMTSLLGIMFTVLALIDIFLS